MKDISVWNWIAEQFLHHRPVILAAVVDYEKGSPGKTGFMMCVTEQEFIGTIGGGLMEFTQIAYCRTLLAQKMEGAYVKKLVHRPNASDGEPSGLICAGSETVCYLPLTPAHSDTVNAIRASLRSFAPAHVTYSPVGLLYQSGKQERHSHFHFTGPDQWLYHENLGAEYTAHVVGGGHVGRAVAALLDTLDFNVLLFDERSDAPGIMDQQLTVRKSVIPYDTVGEYIEEGPKNFVAVVTSAIQSDRAAIQSIVGKKLGYLGLMGTQAKIQRIMNSFSKDERLQLNDIHAPIGIPVNSRTVEEIAVSIAAEMIGVKNKE